MIVKQSFSLYGLYCLIIANSIYKPPIIIGILISKKRPKLTEVYPAEGIPKTFTFGLFFNAKSKLSAALAVLLFITTATFSLVSFCVMIIYKDSVR